MGVRTKDDTALDGEDYKAIDKVITITKGQAEHIVEIEIIDDDNWEPDEDFLVELYDPETKVRLQGEDTICRVTIIDDDEPGQLSFAERNIKVLGKDGKAFVRVVRTNGSDGLIKCKFETFNDAADNDHKAQPYEDYLP